MPGSDIYHACATFKDASSRRGHNAAWCRCFWLDIDCGEGKPYVDADAGIQAVDEFANRLSLPLPLCVRSGRGVHAYFVLSESIPAQRWAETARIFKHTAEMLGLHADPSRTADVSSILRPPGTINTKNGAIVECDGECESVSIETFEKKLAPFASMAGSISSQSAVVTGKPTSTTQTTNILGGLSGAPDFTQGYPDGQRTNELAKRAGYLLGTGHSFEDTLSKCTAWNAYNSPPLDQVKLVHDITSYAKREAEKQKATPLPVEVKTILPPVPIPFKWGTTGSLMVCYKDEDGTLREEVVSKYPLFMSTVCRRESADFQMYAFSQYHPHNGWTDFVLPAEDVKGTNWEAVFAKHTADIQHKSFRNYVATQAVILKGQAMDTPLYEQFGWKEDNASFLIGHALIKKGGASYAYGDNNLLPRMKAMALPKHGSREAWTASANLLGAPEYRAHMFAVLVGMAAPLMPFVLSASDGGAILHMVSKGSGRGKSNVLDAIASVWGRKNAISTAGADTDNAKFGVISTLKNVPVLEEELGWRDKMVDAAFVKRFTAGRNKLRALRDGSVPFKDTSYQTVLVSAANRSLYQSVVESNDEGAVARIFELYLEKPDAESFKYLDQVILKMMANCGYAGRTIIACLLDQGADSLHEECQKVKQTYINNLKTNSSHRYVIDVLTIARVMGRIVNEAGILLFDQKDVITWGENQVRDRMLGDSNHASASAVLNTYINQVFAAECLVVAHEYKARVPTAVIQAPMRQLTMRLERDNQKLHIAIEPLREWLQDRRYDYHTFLKNLEECTPTSGPIVLDGRRMTTLGAGTSFAGGRVPCWEVDMAHPAMCEGSDKAITKVNLNQVIEVHEWGKK